MQLTPQPPSSPRPAGLPRKTVDPPLQPTVSQRPQSARSAAAGAASSAGGSSRPGSAAAGRGALSARQRFPSTEYAPLHIPIGQLAPPMKIKMTTFGYELRLVKDLLPGSLARELHVPQPILSPRPVPRPISLSPRTKHNEFVIRPSRGLSVWQIQHPAGSEEKLAHLSAVEAKMEAHRAMASGQSRSYEERLEEERLFAEQADILAALQWENPHSFFDAIDVDRSGTLTLGELREALLARGLSEKMAEPIVRDFDADNDGEISRDEWTVGFYTSRLCTVPLPSGEDFADLKQGSAGCSIPQTELRAITLRQLRDVYRHLSRRCGYEKWRNFHKQLLTAKTVTLYDLTRYVIRPCTFKRQCAYVELVASHPQQPRWFVSHWWGEHIFDFVACLGAHARDRMPNEKLESTYWVCAYANNQWKLDDAISDDPGRTSFHRALTLSQGTVAVLDKDGVIFNRIWCCYEAHVSLANSRPGYLFDVYTSLGSGRGVGLTDGMAVCDIVNSSAGVTKKMREEKFPLELAARSIRISLEVGRSSVEADRVHILNKMAGSRDLNAPPPANCSRFDDLNGTLRARFAAGALVRAFSAGTEPQHVAMQQEMIKALSNGQLRHLDLNFDSCSNFTAEIADQLAQSMPRGLGQMTLRLNGHGDTFMQALCMRYRLYGGMDKLISLDYEGNQLGARGMLDLSKTIRTKFLQNLTSLKLDKNNIDDMDIITLCRSLSGGIWQNLGTLSLESNKIGDKGMQAIAKLLQGKDNLPQLDRLMLRGNPAAKFRVDDVHRQLKARGRGLKQSDAVNDTQSKEKANQRKASRVWEPAGVD